MATLEQYLEALIALETQTAAASLNPSDIQKTEWYYGFVCGMQMGLRKAEELLNKQLEEVDDDGIEPRRHSANRRRAGT